MLSRRREQFIVFLGLVAVNAALGRYLYRQGRDYQGRTQWIYGGVAQAEGSALPTRQARNVEAQSFAEIVNRSLFRQDRGNESPTESAKVPELPFLYGTMNLGNGSFALMAAGDQPTGLSKRVFPGEEIGGYKLVSIAGSQVVVEWGEKKVTIDVSESARRVPRVIEKTQNTVATSPPVASSSAGSGSQVTTVTPSSRSRTDARKTSGPAGYNAPPGAPVDAPAGTIIGGKRKVVQRLFGMEKVYWEDVQNTNETPASPSPKQP
jgi:hypothetical protein